MTTHTLIPDRNTLTNQLVRWLSPNEQGYFITLNSLVTLNDATDPRFEQELHRLQPLVCKVIGFLKEHCFGNEYIRTHDECRLKCVIAYEVGHETHRLHAHILAAHDGSTNRDCYSVSRFFRRKWPKLVGASHPRGLVHVTPADIPRDRIWYMTKQTQFISRWHSESSIDFA